MIKHSSKYISMAAKVELELPEGSPARYLLNESQYALHDAEVALVTAYRNFRTGLRIAAGDGNELAARYLEETTWDLT